MTSRRITIEVDEADLRAVIVEAIYADVWTTPKPEYGPDWHHFVTRGAAVRAADAVLAAIGDENQRLREALISVAVARQEADDYDHPNFDWRMLARSMESVARRALKEGS